jgi:hypothetical protein
MFWGVPANVLARNLAPELKLEETKKSKIKSNQKKSSKQDTSRLEGCGYRGRWAPPAFDHVTKGENWHVKRSFCSIFTRISPADWSF